MSTMRSSASTRLSSQTLGRTVSVTKRGVWRHPWWTEAQWSAEGKAWTCFVKAGFVNGRAPVVSTTVGALREARGTFYGQLVDAHAGAAEIAQAARLASSEDDYRGMSNGTRIDVPLYLRPPVGLHGWQAVTRIPEYFRLRGAVRPPVTLDRNTGTAVVATPVEGARYLVSCDVMVRQPRAALTSSIEVNASGAVTGTSLVTQTLGMRAENAAEPPRILSGSYSAMQEERNRAGAAGRVVDNYEEADWDLLRVATVYLLSPPDVGADAVPDATWEPHVAHALFWNLHWTQPLLRDAMFNENIFAPLLGTLSVLGGGVGFLWASAVTASLNDAMQGAYNNLAAASLAGSFWTPTGGGTASEPPAPTKPAARKTLDKAANAQAKTTSAAEQLAVRLDPEFPFAAMTFNRSFLS